MAKTKDQSKKSYSHSVHLPRTEFPMRGDLAKREPQWLEFWEKGRIYEKMLEKAAARSPFVLHDGPPYANGHIHIGHAFNKIIKDMVVKSQSLLGRRTPYLPGWDCHGLPIEHALLKSQKRSQRSVDDLPAFRQDAAAFAEGFIAIQKDEFRRLGILGEWDKPYKTLSNEYESAILRAFRFLYKKGYIYRGRKTVPWCITCETALAEAEVEYKNKTSPSVYVSLPVKRIEGDDPRAGKPWTFVKDGVGVLIWTTTPWTLPANMAVAFNPSLRYQVMTAELDGGREVNLLTAVDRQSAVIKALGAEKYRMHPGVYSGKELVEAGIVCETPFGHCAEFKYKISKGVLADYVSAEDGTGVVHTAPGHGADDYYTGLKEGLEILCPIDGRGRFTDEAAGTGLEGMHVFREGNPAVIEKLSADGRMLAVGKVEHSCQHCWRCRNPIAFRATEQWFLSVTHDGLREKLLEAIKGVKWVPAAGEERISGMVAGRPDWCLSRQRLWGTPIPVFWCLGCGEVMADDEVLAAVEKRVSEVGSDFWFAKQDGPVVLGSGGWNFIPGKACSKCGKNSYRRETDILDVWMDSGASWLAVLGEDSVPCDLYVEGSDQHRGWFQSSLVMATAITGAAPYKAVLTHGFVLDDKGRAMSKSLGNVVSPQKVIDKLGADVLRLWVALADYSDDVRLSEKLLAGPTDVYRKLRNTFKYLLGNTFDFDPSRSRRGYADLPELERFILKRLFDLEKTVRESYEAFAFRKAAVSLVDFCNLTLSAFYFDVRKDALYTLKTDDPRRRSVQTVLWECLLRIANLASPILSYTCEEVWQELRRGLAERKSGFKIEESIFLHDLDAVPAVWNNEKLVERWEIFLKFRARVLKALEEARAAKKIGAPLQAKVSVGPAGETERILLSEFGPESLAELCIVSAFELSGAPEPRIEKAPGEKCPRCWRYRTDIGASKEDPALCARCVSQLSS